MPIYRTEKTSDGGYRTCASFVSFDPVATYEMLAVPRAGHRA